MMNIEKKRVLENRKRIKYWKHWGPFLAERQWGTVREDYSSDGTTWGYFTYENAMERAYRWGEDGIAGISDSRCRLCFALSFWNGEDPFIKERMFGLTNPEGNHGEDVKEYYFYLDNTPTHSYMKYLYKYPQGAFPYEQLRSINGKRSQEEGEYELIDTGIFDHNRYYDVFIEYGKKSPDDIAIRITIENRGNEEKILHVLPNFWARNQWFKEGVKKPEFSMYHEGCISVIHEKLGTWFLHGESPKELLFTENETKGSGLFAKDGFNEYLVHGKKEGVNPAKKGSKSAFHYELHLPAYGKHEIHLRLSKDKEKSLKEVPKILVARKKDADTFYSEIIPSNLSEDHKNIARQAYAGLLWNKMYYNLIIPEWLAGDQNFYPPLSPHDPSIARNSDWLHLYCDDIVSAPDKWEFNMFFSWDTAFHALPLAALDADYAKHHLTLLTQEWYMHPNGMFPACEWNFNDVNPPVHAWAVWRVFKIDEKLNKTSDRIFLEKNFQKLLLNFTWWVNRKDRSGKNIFQGGFLGLDNISVFNRSAKFPPGMELYQSDATSWMGMFTLNMLTITFELAQHDRAYENIANKFYNHFLFIADAINYSVGHSEPLWSEEDGFYYDLLKTADGALHPLKVRSLVGLMPLLAVATVEPKVFENLGVFKRKMDWLLNHRGDLSEKIACMRTPGVEGRRLLSIVTKERLIKVLKLMLDENEFLSPYGIRSLSKYHQNRPFELQLDGKTFSVDYEPGESRSRLFGGNSNWRGPVWFPINLLLIESLQKYHHYYGDDLKVEFPTGSGDYKNLWDVAAALSKRLVSIFETNEKGERPVFGKCSKFQTDPHFKDYILFYEYFHGGSGMGLGGGHQMGWTATVAKLIKQLGEFGHL